MAPLEVEHYRPKQAVSSRDLSPGEVHNGYYWLGNEWTNLLLSCRACNGANAKGTRFPISVPANRVAMGRPVTPPLNLNRRVCRLDLAPLLNEGPVILNPEIDTPEDHLTFNRVSGQIIERGGSARGMESIAILRLDRDSLLVKRSKILKSYIKDMKILIEGRRTGRCTSDANLMASFEPICRSILSRQEISSPYTLWGRFINTEIENLIVLKLPAPYRQVFREAYRYSVQHP
jgi:hypothetical protein